jgi:purine-binding chemotaxis protein CheW
MDNAQDDTRNMQEWSIRDALTLDTAAREREILRQRADAYAAPVKAGDETADQLTLLTFRLGSEYYGVQVDVVRGVRVMPRLTPVPSVPPMYRGVVNLRGQIITVLDLAAFFELERDEQASELVIVEAAGLTLGLLAAHVQDVTRLRRDVLQPFDYFRYTLGITADRLVVLDIPLMLQDERLIIGAADE